MIIVNHSSRIDQAALVRRDRPRVDGRRASRITALHAPAGDDVL